jgi:hypothetical protein
VDRDAHEFIWCVSLEGNQESFLDIQERYNTSSERAGAFQTFPNCIDSMQISFVDALDLPK